MAVGYSFDDKGVAHTLAERWDGGAWTVVPTVDRAGPGENRLEAVACPAASACVAVGGSGAQALAESWDGSRWSIEPTPTPIGAQERRRTPSRGAAWLAGSDGA